MWLATPAGIVFPIPFVFITIILLFVDRSKCDWEHVVLSKIEPPPPFFIRSNWNAIDFQSY